MAHRPRTSSAARRFARAVADAVGLITGVIRSDRFFEGSIATALDDGTLAAAVHRLRRWSTRDADYGR